MIREADFYAAAERRIERLTWILGIAGAGFAEVRYDWRMGAGVLAGTAVGWLNFRWLKQGIGSAVETMARTAREAGEPSPGPADRRSAAKIPKRIYVWFLGRYVLLLAAVYVILSARFVAGMAILAGLFAIVAAVLGELLYQVLFARET